MAEFLREAVGVEGRELSEELALNSSELRLSEASLRPLLMELLSSQLQGQSRCQSPLPSASSTLWCFPSPGPAGVQTSAPRQGAGTRQPRQAAAQPGTGLVSRQHTSPSDPTSLRYGLYTSFFRDGGHLCSKGWQHTQRQGWQHRGWH